MAARSNKKQKSKKKDLIHGIAYSDALFASIGEGAIVIDSMGRIERVNNAAIELLGCSKKELVGKWYPESVPLEDEKGKPIPNISRPVTEAFLSSKPVFKKAVIRRKDGPKFMAALTVSPIILNDEPIGAVQVFRDITEEFELQAAKDEFIAIASHQLRTPATAVKQYLGILLQGYSGKFTKEQGKLIKTAYDSNERQLAVIADLLITAQIDTKKVRLNKTRFSLTAVLKAIADDQKDRLKNRSQKVIIKAEQKNEVLADKLYIRMALENLIDNASKYSPAGSKIIIELASSKKWQLVKITDQGIGIAESERNRLFQKFSRLQNAISIEVSGSGLGLYIVKKIIDAHDGKISVRSKLGKSSTFSVELPSL